MENIKEKLNNIKTDTDFTLMVENKNGKKLQHSIGHSTPMTLYRSASTSKWVTATIILRAVQEGKLSLQDHPQKYIDFWDKKGKLSKITLKDLLNFSSGLKNKPFCLNFKRANFKKCVQQIMKKNRWAKASGINYNYGPNHLQVAGFMTMNALGLNSWEEVFQKFQKETQLFPNSSYSLPSKQNPRLAGGMYWNAKDYFAFLSAIYHNRILNKKLTDMMTSDQLGSASIRNSPAKSGIEEDWHYGFGVWIECHNVNFNCTKRSRVSSPGLFGAYPFIDYEHGYFGILAREGKFNTFKNGYEVFENVSNNLELWAK